MLKVSERVRCLRLVCKKTSQFSLYVRDLVIYCKVGQGLLEMAVNDAYVGVGSGGGQNKA